MYCLQGGLCIFQPGNVTGWAVKGLIMGLVLLQTALHSA